jgi:hypothetical protein
MMRRAAKTLLILCTCVLSFCIWFYIAADYDYGALAGTYVYHDHDVRCVLRLRSDGSFHQELTASSGTQTAGGRWRRIGEGGVAFSLGFLRLPHAQTFVERFHTRYGNPDDDAYYGHFEKILTLYPKLIIDGDGDDPVLYRRLF